MFHLRRAGRLTGDAALSADIKRHLAETERHRQLVRERLSALGHPPRGLLDAAVTSNRLGFFAYTALSSEAPGKLIVDSYAYEHFEIAAYRMLAHPAERWRDAGTGELALAILADEEEMARRLEAGFDRAFDAARSRADGPIGDNVVVHLRDAHALAIQAMVLMGLGARVAGTAQLAAAYRSRAATKRRHRRELARRLGELGRRPAPLKDAVMAAAGTAWCAVWSGQRDTPAKLMCFASAAVPVEIAAYELLGREAARAGDGSTHRLVLRLLENERDEAQRLAALFAQAEEAAEATSS
jgi:ferritin-like metal-binding protein YciE